MKYRGVAVALAMAALLTVPGLAAAADSSPAPSDPVRVSVEVVYRGSELAGPLSIIGPVTPGCYYAATNALGNGVYSYTIWQTLSYDGTNSTYFPLPGHSATSDLGWSLTSGVDTHWWISQPRTAAAKGQWTFTQYVGGQPYKSASGWVQINLSGSGSVSCSSS